MLKRLGREPVVDLALPRLKHPARVIAPKRFKAKSGRKLNPGTAHASPRMIDPNRFCDSVSTGGSASAFQNASCSVAVIAKVC